MFRARDFTTVLLATKAFRDLTHELGLTGIEFAKCPSVRVLSVPVACPALAAALSDTERSRQGEADLYHSPTRSVAHHCHSYCRQRPLIELKRIVCICAGDLLTKPQERRSVN